MAAPRKRTTKRTTATRSRTPAKSGRSSTSFVAMGILAGLAIAILFYAILIRQDANLAKGTVPQYAHTPNQTDVLTPLPPRPREEAAPARSPAQSQAPAQSVVEAPAKPQQSIAEETAQLSPRQATTPPAKTPEQPKAPVAAATKAPSTQTAPTKKPAPSMTEDAIGNLIIQNEKSAQRQTPKPTPQAKAPVAPSPSSAAKDDADHLGALIKTIPPVAASPSVSKAANISTKQNSAINAVPEKTIALKPVPTKETPFYLQSASYKSADEADTMRAQLLLLGYSTAYTHKGLVNNQTVYRVRVGPYTSSAELEKAKKNLTAAKLKLSPVH